ncbi:MAG: ATP-binding protein [Phocaeicola sp.]
MAAAAIRKKYPVGIQSFADIIERGCEYVDKTALIYNMTHSGGFTYFLSRPRRFGKSLLVSTLKAYFEGKRELFKGLAMEQLETEWTEYPVLHLDLSRGKYHKVEELNSILLYHLCKWEALYGAPQEGQELGTRFMGVIERAYHQTGRKVVVLIDEYDSALLDSTNNKALQEELRNIIRAFYSPLKASTPYLRFLFLTGITKFSQMSIFSELNNLNNISMMPQYEAICGITEEELLTQLGEGIQALADANEESYEEACLHLKKQYDGYHFSKQLTDVYNPFSVVSTLENRMYSNYWFSTGTPTFLLELLKTLNVSIPNLDGIDAQLDDFDRSTELITNIVPVLYQSGYLTIKSYNPIFKSYKLGYPNEEVRMGFLSCLLPDYVQVDTLTGNSFIMKFIQDLMNGDLEGCLTRMQTFFAEIPYVLENKSEKHYQTIFYILFKLMGQFVEAEVYTATGRIDAMLALADAIYLFEFKVDQSAQIALEQIESKGYAMKYQLDGRPIYKIGINFSSEQRTLSEWVVKEESI